MALLCGHHESLRIRTFDSRTEYCDLCEVRKEAADAVATERRLLSEVRSLRNDVKNSRLPADELRASVVRRLAAVEGK